MESLVSRASMQLLLPNNEPVIKRYPVILECFYCFSINYFAFPLEKLNESAKILTLYSPVWRIRHVLPKFRF